VRNTKNPGNAESLDLKGGNKLEDEKSSHGALELVVLTGDLGTSWYV